jgi:hypothetical protein
MILDTTLGAVGVVEKPTRRRSGAVDDHAAWRARRATDPETPLDGRVGRPERAERSVAAEGAEGDR